MWMRIVFLKWNKQSMRCYDIFLNKLEIEVIEKITDTEGRFILLKCNIQGTKIMIYNVYAPNNEKDHVAFLLFLKEKLEFIDTTEYEYIIGAGDWNFTFKIIDRSVGNYKYEKWEKSAYTL